MVKHIPKIFGSAQFLGLATFFLLSVRKQVIDNSMARFLTLNRGKVGIIKTGIFKYPWYIYHGSQKRTMLKPDKLGSL